MKTTDGKIKLIAVCGMNCGICMAYLREKNKCRGCRTYDPDKPVTRQLCKIKNCESVLEKNLNFCFECNNFFCDKLEHLDKRYRTRYKMSMIENLKRIKKSGITKFMKNEKERWLCPECGGAVCVHNKKCYACNAIVPIKDPSI